MERIEETQPVEREVVVPASAEETWQALTDSDQLAEWLGEEAELELRPGGELAIRIGAEDRAGFFEEVDAPNRLVFWWHEGESDASRVEIDLVEDPEGTRVRVVESRPLLVLDGAPLSVDAWPGANASSPEMSAALSSVG
jgi:uncharacterized protein YndB with AHSA1/START domain